MCRTATASFAHRGQAGRQGLRRPVPPPTRTRWHDDRPLPWGSHCPTEYPPPPDRDRSSTRSRGHTRCGGSEAFLAIPGRDPLAGAPRTVVRRQESGPGAPMCRVDWSMVRALVVAFGLAAVGGLTAYEPPDYSKCPTKGSGQVRVAVVVDARSLGGSTGVVCVVVTRDLTGSARSGPGPIGSASRGPASTPRTASCAPSTASRPRRRAARTGRTDPSTGRTGWAARAGATRRSGRAPAR